MTRAGDCACSSIISACNDSGCPRGRGKKCLYCGFPMDTPQKAHDFIHQQGDALTEWIGARREESERADAAEQSAERMQRDFQDAWEQFEADFLKYADIDKQTDCFVILATKLYIAGKPVRKAIGDARAALAKGRAPTAREAAIAIVMRPNPDFNKPDERICTCGSDCVPGPFHRPGCPSRHVGP